MKPRNLLIALCIVAVAAPVTVQAQEIELASYTPEQRWERAASQFTVSVVAAIVYAKSMGQSVEELAEAWMDLFGPGWGEPGSGSLTIVQSIHRNLALWPDCELEIVEQSEASVTVRSNQPWAVYFGEDEVWYGVTLDEWEKTFKVFNARLADHLGLGYEDWVEDGWWYMKFTLTD
jgi:hypothetical protein